MSSEGAKTFAVIRVLEVMTNRRREHKESVLAYHPDAVNTCT